MITATTTMMMAAKTIATRIKAFALNDDATPRGWAQNHPVAGARCRHLRGSGARHATRNGDAL
ncbi:MAG: hypothetical protein ACE148_15400 [Vicinamibacterales bacterium]